MKLEEIILGLLSQPASGYELKRAFDGAINYFWYADIAQVYRTLQRMEDHGLVKSQEEASSSGPPRRVYRRTAAGKKRLFTALRKPPQIGGERHGHVAQLVFLGQIGDPRVTAEFVRQMRDHFVGRLAILKHIEANEPESELSKMSDEDFHGYLGLQMGIESTAARIKWCDRAIRWVEQREV